MVSNRTLVQIAAWGGVIVTGTGYYLQNRLIDRARSCDFYKSALKQLRAHPGAVYYLGEPIKDKRFKLSDTENNYADSEVARFRIPVSGSKERGHYYFWAVNSEGKWSVNRAELELKSKPDERLVIVGNNVFVGSKREKFYYLNTLLCLAKSLQSRAVTVDLRCDSYVCGTITSVDGYMNITFADAVFVNPRGNEYKYESLFLSARNIRYIHIPEDVNIILSIKKEVINEKKPKPEQPTLKSRKAKKALKQHLDTVASLKPEKQ